MTIVWLIVTAVAMIVVSGFFAAAETAISSVSRADLEEIAEESPRTGGLVRRIAESPEAHANALTFTRVLLETIAAVLVTIILMDVFDTRWQAFVAAVLVMMVVSFVLTGASPRSVGRAHPAPVVRASAWITRVVRVVLGPIAAVLVRVGDRVTPGRPSRAGSVTSEEQLLSMIDEAAELDVLEDEDRERIHSLFAFSDRIVREVMIARTDMITIDAQTNTADAVAKFLDDGISRAPVTGRDGDDVRGVLYFKDLVAHHLAGDPAPVDQIMRPAPFVPETLPADELLRRMQSTSTHFAMVVDEYGGVAGLVTLEDLIEELVGNINDEYDSDRAEIVEVEPGTYRVPSRLPTEELGELFEIDLEDDDVDTVGGLIGKELGKVPERDDVAISHGLRLAAEQIGRRGRVTTVLVSRADVDDEARDEPQSEPEPGRGDVEAALRRRAAEEHAEHERSHR